MAKAQKKPEPKKKKQAKPGVSAENNSVAVESIEVHGNVEGDIHFGHEYIVESIKTEYSLFTIPAPVKDFTGREEQIEKLKADFSRGVLITGISGGGGIGKTELARKLAQEIKANYPEAGLSIDLLGTSENPLTTEEAMRRLLEPFYPNQKLPDEPEQLRGLYQQTFAAKKALLLLDNALNAAQVRSLIPTSNSVAIVTSRNNFNLSEFGLSQPLQLDLLSLEESRKLLRADSPKLQETADAELDQLATFCGRLPLALRVAASLLNERKDWSSANLLNRLEDEYKRLELLSRDTDMQRNVQATLALSYDLLDGDLKTKFRQLGLFTAPFVKISAQALWDLEDADLADDLLGKLSNRSLVNILPISAARVDTRPDEEGNEVLYTYSLHDLTRLFALSQLLRDEEETKTAVIRHADHYLGWASAADNLYEKGGANILLGLSQFRLIWPHLDSAYKRLLPDQKSLPRPEKADRWLSDFPGLCAYVLDLHLPPREKIFILQSALESARRLEDKQAEGVHLGNLGIAYKNLGEARKAIEFYEQAMIIAREIGDKRNEGNWLGNLGNAYENLGEARKAIEFYKQAMIIAREIGDRRGEGADLGNLGIAYKNLGEARKAIEFYEQAIVIAKEIGDRRGEGAALGNLGNAYAALGEARKAIEYHEQALLIDREIDDRRGEGAALGNLGLAYKKLGDKESARKVWKQALEIFRAIESPHVKSVEGWLAGLEGEDSSK